MGDESEFRAQALREVTDLLLRLARQQPDPGSVEQSADVLAAAMGAVIGLTMAARDKGLEAGAVRAMLHFALVEMVDAYLAEEARR